MLEWMNRVLEIEQAVRNLPPLEQWEFAHRLLEDLQEGSRGAAAHQVSGDSGVPIPPLPDYSARRRRIFGSKVVPNMVLAARAEEPW